MGNKYKHSTSQLLNFTQDSYLERTSRPIYAVVFLLPFIIFYELGTIFINTDVLNQSQVRVVAFVWLQRSLNEYLGFGSKLAWATPPLAVVIILIALQLVSRKPWRFSLGDIWPMAVECILLAVPLIVLILFLNSLANNQADIGQSNSCAIRVRCASSINRESRHEQQHTRYGQCNTQSCPRAKRRDAIRNTQCDNPVPSCSAITGDGLSATEPGSAEGKSKSLLANIITGIGAGIYEELVFRLILICALMLLFQDILRFSQRNAIIFSVLVSAALFSAYHHIDFLTGRLNQRELFNWTAFSFRTIAGVYFAALFAIRGFGITAGTHAFYDIIATFINAVFFQQ